MRLRDAVIGFFTLAALAGCASGTGPSGGGQVGVPADSVTVGNNGQIVVASAHNGTVNPALDTVAVGRSVTRTWTNARGISHSVQSRVGRGGE